MYKLGGGIKGRRCDADEEEEEQPEANVIKIFTAVFYKLALKNRLLAQLRNIRLG
jgi:hypothetical protein